MFTCYLDLKSYITVFKLSDIITDDLLLGSVRGVEEMMGRGVLYCTNNEMIRQG